MAEQIAQLIASFLGIYVLIGFIYAIAVHTKGLHAFDPAAKDSPLLFKVMTVPGLVLLWPALIIKWRLLRGPR